MNQSLVSGQGGRALVILAHGFMGTRVQLLPMAASLSRKYDVINFGYKSRMGNLEDHAQTLIDTVQARQNRQAQTVHFVTHSFGGVVLHNAFSNGLMDALGKVSKNTRCVMIAPPLRGASFARAFQLDQLTGPNMLKNTVHATARAFLGDKAGLQLMTKDESWFDQRLGSVPGEIDVLVVAGTRGKLNPLIPGESDGVVAVDETMLQREHYRLTVALTHNLLLYSPLVVRSVDKFLSGYPVGILQTQTEISKRQRGNCDRCDTW